MLKIVKKTKIVKDEKGKDKEVTYHNIYLFGVCIRSVSPTESTKLYYLCKGYLENAIPQKEESK